MVKGYWLFTGATNRPDYIKGTDKVIPLLNYLSITSCRREWERRYGSTIFDLDAMWRKVVTFKGRQFHRCPLHRRLGEPKIQPGRCGGEKIPRLCWESTPLQSNQQPDVMPSPAQIM
jgi:hypothetical protein